MQQPPPGDWPDFSGDYYRYLLRLARRRLVGFEHHAEDVIDRAVERWVRIPSEHPSARIETLIKSEAGSLLRSEERRRHREERVTGDRSTRGSEAAAHDTDDQLLRLELARACRRLGVDMSAIDLEVFELLMAGYNLAETARVMGVRRHVVKNSRHRWQQVVRYMWSE